MACPTCHRTPDQARADCWVGQKVPNGHRDPSNACGNCLGNVEAAAAGEQCPTCRHWLHHVTHPDGSIVIDGHHYRIGPDSAVAGRGFGGRRHVIRFHDGRTVETTNLWHQGEVPAFFRDRLPDNATFLDCHLVNHPGETT